ncbi:uncharacterized protein PFL1_06350 [Pseudozyma flocculosa PF-1]|uniref:histone acetyltransferase n=2 Tax=Pseudozyma flocculosa TaxID=84751 RepID=A0A5C3FAQ0_9BASI|nr:uncharacterized protein PFL1_06350 [Pseudozyma flocculosa PF-1]EPQ26142.1 hypothetical protein PFL1_06350 [Pseudozyma flocculosa PF-1]SPO40389.1 uncharacterized protein PSFLO_05871 [Pseudozyma flocculosa]
MSLLETLESSLRSSPPPLAEAGSVRLHTLVSVPRAVKSLYPLAHIHPHHLDSSRNSSPVSAHLEHIVVTASWSPRDAAAAAAAAASPQATLIYALEAFLYTLPEHGSAVLYISKLDTTGYAPASLPPSLRAGLAEKTLGPGVAYGNTLTAQLSSAFVQHFSTFKHWRRSDVATTQVRHLAVHILARSQRAYLFPGSPENGRKKVLSDGGLIRWWRDVMSDAIVASRKSPHRSGGQANGMEQQLGTDARAFYLVPGYNRLESHVLLPLPPAPSVPSASTSNPTAEATRPSKQQTLQEAGWVYGHPYSAEGASCSPSDLPPLPLHWQRSALARSSLGQDGPAEAQTDPAQPGYDPKKVRCISTLMPHFSDDPKTRFMDELQRDAHEHAGWKKVEKAAATAAEGLQEDAKDGREADGTEGTSQRANADGGGGEPASKRAKLDDGSPGPSSSSTSPPSQEPATATSLAAPIGSIGSITATTSTASSSTKMTPLPILRGQMRERRSLDDLSIDEFWIRMGFRQECCSGNAVGVLVCLFTQPHPSSSEAQPQVTTAAAGTTTTVVPPASLPLSLPHPTIQDLVFKRLMRDVCEWDKEANARELTKAWDEQVNKAVVRKGGLAAVVAASAATSQADDRGENGHANAAGGEEMVGRGIIWKDIELAAPSAAQVQEVEEEVKRKQAQQQADNGGRRGTGSADGGRPQTNVLSVKRKKKPAA